MKGEQPMTQRDQSNRGPFVVGEVRAQPMPITVERESEVGIWIASVVDLNRSAIGMTPREAVERLVGHLDWLKIETLDGALLYRLDPIGER